MRNVDLTVVPVVIRACNEPGEKKKEIRGSVGTIQTMVLFKNAKILRIDAITYYPMQATNYCWCENLMRE